MGSHLRQHPQRGAERSELCRTVEHNEELEAVKVEARRLHRSARTWGVEIPEEWYCTDPDDSESFIGGLYHDRVRSRISNKRWTMLTSGVGLVGGILGIAALIKTC